MKGQLLRWANILGEAGLFRWLCPGTLPVFMLHRVTNGNDEVPRGMPASQLRRYLQYLADKGFQVLSMEDLWCTLSEGRRIPSKSVMFTIDDGFYDHHDVAAKVFDEFGFPLNFFVITDFLDQKLWPWDDQVSYAFKNSSVVQTVIRLPSGAAYSINIAEKSTRSTLREVRNALKKGPQVEVYKWLREELFKKLEVDFPPNVPPEYRPMSWDNARSLRERGHGVYPHSCTHRILSVLSPTEKREEIRESLKRVGSELNYSPRVFAYPTGLIADYDRDDIEELKWAGFRMAFNTVPGHVRQGQDKYQLPRFSLPESIEDYMQVVNRVEALKEKLRS